MVVHKKEDKVGKYNPLDIIAWRHRTQGQITTYDKISLLRSLSGVTCIVVGLATCLVPFTTMPLVALGSYLLGYDSKIWLPKVIYKIKLLGDWIYCNRTPKRIKGTIKQRVLGWN